MHYDVEIHQVRRLVFDKITNSVFKTADFLVDSNIPLKALDIIGNYWYSQLIVSRKKLLGNEQWRAAVDKCEPLRELTPAEAFRLNV